MSITHFSGPVASANGFQNGTTSIETLEAADTLVAADNGKVIFLDLAGGFTVTLPDATAGTRFKFVVKTAPTTAYIIGSGSDNIIGGFSSVEDAAGSADYDGSANTVEFVANKAAIGDWCELVSDGTSWYVSGNSNVQDGLTITDS